MEDSTLSEDKKERVRTMYTCFVESDKKCLDNLVSDYETMDNEYTQNYIAELEEQRQRFVKKLLEEANNHAETQRSDTYETLQKKFTDAKKAYANYLAGAEYDTQHDDLLQNAKEHAESDLQTCVDVKEQIRDKSLQEWINNYAYDEQDAMQKKCKAIVTESYV